MIDTTLADRVAEIIGAGLVAGVGEPRPGHLTGMSAPHWSDALVSLGACPEAVEWARTQPDPSTAWESCPSASWLVWIYAALVPPTEDARHALVRAACACARSVLRHVPTGELRPLRAIEAAEAWCRKPSDGTSAVARAAAYGANQAAYGAHPAASARAAAISASAACALADAATAWGVRAANAIAWAIVASARAAANGGATIIDAAAHVREHLRPPLDQLAAYARALAWTRAGGAS